MYIRELERLSITSCSLTENLEEMASDHSNSKKRSHKDDDPDWTPTLQKKRPCSKPEAAAAALTTSNGATTTCDQWSEKAVAKLEKEKRRLLYIWQQESDSLLCDKIKAQLESESAMTNSSLAGQPLHRGWPARLDQLQADNSSIKTV